MIKQAINIEMIRQNADSDYLHSKIYFENQFICDVLEIGDGRELQEKHYILKIGRTQDKSHYFVAIYDFKEMFISIFHPDNYVKNKGYLIRKNNNFLATGKLVNDYFIENIEDCYSNFFLLVQKFSKDDTEIILKVTNKINEK